MKLTGRGKNVFFCPSCNTTKPQKGRKHVHGRAVCSECIGKNSGHVRIAKREDAARAGREVMEQYASVFKKLAGKAEGHSNTSGDLATRMG